MIFGLLFLFFCKMLCVARRCKNHCFVLVFVVFRAHRPSHRINKNTFCGVVFVRVFQEGHRQHFFITFYVILGHFGEVFGPQNLQTWVPEKHDKTAPPKKTRAGPKVTQGSAINLQPWGGASPFFDVGPQTRGRSWHHSRSLVSQGRPEVSGHQFERILK